MELGMRGEGCEGKSPCFIQLTVVKKEEGRRKKEEGRVDVHDNLQSSIRQSSIRQSANLKSKIAGPQMQGR
ncbi:MAG: hypothetical protein JGK17_19910 [Microcoleus sp. PH2017_10_PVI_O_A]|uniref:hypothetical protein n=1 Tax=unclassified Microcoleus TaxID=2642155 RepID=UPI001DA570AF|nr:MULTISPECIES: hypothetical protein [unclassified Microcoleus]TAE80024.1 MAG: hypothetical protein EAZ83_19650 [Oscillatoriales cyanobacterium]MCC3407814.1 hypothetical protein [Microcoleus sp. PH2017_10_PVI_O_A]MCC3461974.1 hypothetical protein [Microcoleus sp. PH2017_11_PCY_U_A]MCC3480434.1 hypothetical protein [Microcoleus sp. PH2017_12_PCY_D_A]MCC3531849.1 hypothetical protein [Microcoleus sp. PH2017_21_RUC_O_A]